MIKNAIEIQMYRGDERNIIKIQLKIQLQCGNEEEYN